MHFLSAAKPTDKGMHSVVLVFVVGVGRSEEGTTFSLMCSIRGVFKSYQIFCSEETL